MNYIQQTVSMCIRPKGDPLFSEQATTITMVDDAAGAYIEISQDQSAGKQTIGIDAEEWPALKLAIEEMLEIVKKYNTEIDPQEPT